MKQTHRLEQDINYFIWLHGRCATSEQQFIIDNLNSLMDRYEELTGRPYQPKRDMECRR